MNGLMIYKHIGKYNFQYMKDSEIPLMIESRGVSILLTTPGLQCFGFCHTEELVFFVGFRNIMTEVGPMGNLTCLYIYLYRKDINN